MICYGLVIFHLIFCYDLEIFHLIFVMAVSLNNLYFFTLFLEHLSSNVQCIKRKMKKYTQSGIFFINILLHNSVKIKNQTELNSN